MSAAARAGARARPSGAAPVVPREHGHADTTPGGGRSALLRRAAVLILAGLAFAAILVSRQPQVLLDAQFWGEDGWCWYPDAYQNGWHCLFQPWSGYLQTLPRLMALGTLLFPLAWAPTLFAAAALALQSLPAVFLMSGRMAACWKAPAARPHLPAAPAGSGAGWRGRLLFALAYLGLQNSGETYVNLTNAQWYLALLAFLVLAGGPAASRAGKAFDAVVLGLSGLSGPFCVFLLPIALWAAWSERRMPWHRLAPLLACVLVQGSVIALTAHDGRVGTGLGATAALLVRIVALQVAVGAVLGQHGMLRLIGSVRWWGDALPAGIAAAWLALSLLAAWRGSTLLRMAMAFAAMVLAAALLHPNVSGALPQWQGMIWPAIGVRYYIFPMLAFIGALFTLAADRQVVLRCAGSAVLLLMAAEMPGDWRPNQAWPPEPGWAQTDFSAKAEVFATAPAGTRVTFGIHPAGAVMVLVRR